MKVHVTPNANTCFRALEIELNKLKNYNFHLFANWCRGFCAIIYWFARSNTHLCHWHWFIARIRQLIVLYRMIWLRIDHPMFQNHKNNDTHHQFCGIESYRSYFINAFDCWFDRVLCVCVACLSIPRPSRWHRVLRTHEQTSMVDII